VGAEPVAVAVDGDWDAAVEEPVEEGCCDGGVGEDVAPVSDASVGGEDDGAVEVSLGDDLEEGVGVFGWHGEVAEFVDDEDGWSFEESHGVGPAAFDGCFAAAGGEVGGGGVVGAVAGFGGFVAEADGEVGFPDAGWADQHDVGGVFGVAAGGEIPNEGLIDGGLGCEVEVFETPRCREVRESHPAFEASLFGGVDFGPEELFEELGVGLAGFGGVVER
jgi:hypothetical protein